MRHQSDISKVLLATMGVEPGKGPGHKPVRKGKTKAQKKAARKLAGKHRRLNRTDRKKY